MRLSIVKAMKMNNFNMNKKGISEIISYVLLIVLAVGLATATYYFLLQQTNIMPADVCPDGISITVENYTCNNNGLLNLTLKNSGLFNVGGVRIKIVNDTKTNFEYDLKTIINSPTIPLDLSNVTEILNIPYLRYKNIEKLRIYPYVLDKNNKSFVCEKAFSEVTIGKEICSTQS